MRPTQCLMSAALLAATLACETSPPTAPMEAASEKPVAQLQLYGHGSKEGLITACDAPGYRQFDFWVGHWSVRGIKPDGSIGPVNSSIIERELDGCVIEENWNGNARSINTFDPASGTYNQQYIDASGSHLMLTGGAKPDGSMEMTGTTFFACSQCPNGIFPLISIWQWSAFTPDSVRQLQRVINGLNGQPWQSGIGFDGRYSRRESVTLFPTPQVGPCSNNPLYRQFDFLVGDWAVMNGEANGRESAASGGAVTSTVTRELAGCLVEERVTGPGGYTGWAFNGWNQSEEIWVRTYVNNLGERTFLRGTFDGTRMVLSGTRALADGRSSAVRVTWVPDGEHRVIETWEVSEDGGQTFTAAESITRVRRAT